MVNLKISTIHIDPARNSAAIAEQLERTKKRRDISGVVFAGIAIDNVIANAAIDLFRHASRKGHGWSWLLLDDCTGRVDIMLHVATAIELFTEIAIENVPEISEQACLYISIGMKYNPRLICLNLENVGTLTRQSAKLLSDGLRTNDDGACRLTGLYISRAFLADGAMEELASGLKQNSGLEKLHVSNTLTDSDQAELIESLVTHPSLKEVTLQANQVEALTLAALGNLLTNGRVEILKFNNQNPEDLETDLVGLESEFGAFTKELKGNNYLRQLSLANNNLDDEDMTSLLIRVLMNYPQLEELDLRSNRITSDALETFVMHSVTGSSLRRLRLGDNPAARRGCWEPLMLQIVQRHLQLGDIDITSGVESLFGVRRLPHDPNIQHFLDFNHSGRYLLSRGNTVPLSLWPLVLERANTTLFRSDPRKREARRANVIFHLLQGPSLLQRPFGSLRSTEVMEGGQHLLVTNERLCV